MMENKLPPDTQCRSTPIFPMTAKQPPSQMEKGHLNEDVKMLVAQSCLTLCDPRLLRPWDSPGKNTGVGYYALEILRNQRTGGLMGIRKSLEAEYRDPCRTPSRLLFLCLLFASTWVPFYPSFTAD